MNTPSNAFRPTRVRTIGSAQGGRANLPSDSNDATEDSSGDEIAIRGLALAVKRVREAKREKDKQSSAAD